MAKFKSEAQLRSATAINQSNADPLHVRPQEQPGFMDKIREGVMAPMLPKTLKPAVAGALVVILFMLITGAL